MYCMITPFCIGYRIRVPYPFQWGAPSFDAGEAFAMMMASFVALVEVSHKITTKSLIIMENLNSD